MTSVVVRRLASLLPPPVPPGEFTIDPPPVETREEGGAANWVQYLLPALGSMGSLLFVVTNPRLLSIGRLAASGVSLGGPYALALAAAMCERVLETVVVSGLFPFAGAAQQRLLGWYAPAVGLGVPALRRGLPAAHGRDAAPHVGKRVRPSSAWMGRCRSRTARS